LEKNFTPLTNHTSSLGILKGGFAGVHAHPSAFLHHYKRTGYFPANASLHLKMPVPELNQKGPLALAADFLLRNKFFQFLCTVIPGKRILEIENIFEIFKEDDCGRYWSCTAATFAELSKMKFGISKAKKIMYGKSLTKNHDDGDANVEILLDELEESVQVGSSSGKSTNRTYNERPCPCGIPDHFRRTSNNCLFHRENNIYTHPFYEWANGNI
jgi:hypothetical protein